ncbi:NAD(P)-binding domain-containing protein [Paenibacillus lautus]|uniref:NAD(P)-dependent oxidoreductase n=1 Tax=Paenibacillus lautus TaxID=1401 RepID=UPI002DB982F4|nr:NAD(P)-binding domain-containing protein [Paenibacillus lautus]MEC0204959.1 NAD(P)-binding domain-containing protein [Paenibacillus lautus]
MEPSKQNQGQMIEPKVRETQQNTNKEHVTVLGLGPMGQALAGAFIKNGHATTVWNRTAAKADLLTTQGAVLAPTVTDAVLASQLIIICVLNYDAVRSILSPATSELKGKTLINLTADSPERARDMADWATENGIDYMDGAIMTPITTIGQPSAVVLYSGQEDVYRSHRETLSSLGGTASFLGEDPGRAAAYDIALLDVFLTAMSGYVHALAIARAENIPAKDIAPYAHNIINIMPDIMTYIAQDVDQGVYPGEGSSLISNMASMEHIIHVAEQHGIDSSVLNAAKAIAQRAIHAGHGGDGFSRLVEFNRPTA